MNWLPHLIQTVSDDIPCGYHASGPDASEPTAMAALALIAHERYEEAVCAADWLARIQSGEGSVGVDDSESRPKWPTSLAILAWMAADSARFEKSIDKGVRWALKQKGSTGPNQSHIGHDTTLAGWSWAADTHSWLEPTCFFVLALCRTRQSDHPRTREAMRLIIDRLLPDGGANYGNTVVLGQPLLPHIQPTGIAMIALARESVADCRVAKSLDYLERELSMSTPTASLCYGLLGLAAHGRRPEQADEMLHAAYERELRREQSTYKRAMLALAAAHRNPMLNI